MISEIDLRDWDYDRLRAAVTLVSSKEPVTQQTHYEDDYLRAFIEHVEVLSKTNMKQVAALFKPKGV